MTSLAKTSSQTIKGVQKLQEWVCERLNEPYDHPAVVAKAKQCQAGKKLQKGLNGSICGWAEVQLLMKSVLEELHDASLGRPVNPKDRVTAENSTGEAMINSPRSLKVMQRLGILASELAPKALEDFPEPGRQMRYDAHENQRKKLLDKLRHNYRVEIYNKAHVDDSELSEDAAAMEARLKEKRYNERNEGLLLRKRKDAAKRLVYAISMEHAAANFEQERQERQKVCEERMQKRHEEQRVKNAEKREAAERRIKAAIDNERRQMSEKMAKYHTKKLHQEELMTEKKAKHAEEARNRHLQAAHKEAVRTERKQKAVETAEQRKQQYLEKFAQKEENLQLLLKQRQEATAQKQLKLTLRNELAKESTERQKRVDEFKKQELLHKALLRDSRADRYRYVQREFVKNCKERTRIDTHEREALNLWMANLGLCDDFAPPEWLDLDLTPIKPLLEADKDKYPGMLDGLIESIQPPDKAVRPPVPSLAAQPQVPLYWSKAFRDEGLD
jgi:hypothetical protein|uniref:Uncharacterized protein n=1 Tax=Eutreptiella gymnastica TaxID=73025 RepID=A0A7S4FVW1_9EUGL